ncbi:uncharacterized protein LOC118082292 [Zootoca vivipara]|uniref:uncharacterized protein LOC118082292 n=1 Tax=Zootoca vivipara TaxID=8524 RepID=UPI00293BD951|nr:uncharacterized protein LOC118082292 [Zootoca vivipara]XP_060128553.1 uncharacterized protein LOC118082292 [Zootoca vivipara]XP_060128554.1 uncharacterized protein LOC118082292 [Zootoca vivipara]
MGQQESAQRLQHAEELKGLIEASGQVVHSVESLVELLEDIESYCPSYPEAGSLNLRDWERIGMVLLTSPRASIATVLLWQRCRDAIAKVGIALGSNRKRSVTSNQGPSLPDSRLQGEKVKTSPVSAPKAKTATVAANAETAGVQDVNSLDSPLAPEKPMVSAVCKGFQMERDKGALSSEELEAGMQAFPVTQVVNAQGQAQYNWSSLSYQIMRELRKSLKETGLRSTFTLGLLESVSNSYDLIPQDWKEQQKGTLAGLPAFLLAAYLNVPRASNCIAGSCAVEHAGDWVILSELKRALFAKANSIKLTMPEQMFPFNPGR